MIERCFFCDKIIVPLNLLTTNEIKDYLFKEGIEYTLNYTKSRSKIGKKHICLVCEKDLREIANTAFFEVFEECNMCEEK